jgi:hypothetical protein
VRRAPEVLALAFVLSAAAAPGRARGNGAFPDSQSVLTPADRPQELILPTNFGLVISEDGGQSWTWSCEQDANALAMLYQMGPAPRHRLFAVANQQVVYSDDGSCSWQIAGGMVANQSITDFFPDPTNANRGLAVGIASTVYSVFESTADGGKTFDRMLFQASGGDAINGVEIARSRPATIYLSLTSSNNNPKLARSTDGGTTWTVTDLTASLGNGILRIISVDPDNPDVVLLRLLASTNQALAVTRDGGMTATAPLTIMGSFTAFVRLPDGTLLLGAMVDSGSVPALFRSHDGGATFAQLTSPGIKGLSQRGGIAYAATDNFGVGFALGSSSDQGTTWQAVMSYDKIQAIVACLRGNAQCQASCEGLAGIGDMSPGMIWDEAVCTANPPGTAGAGGSGGTGAGGSGGGTTGTAGAPAGGAGGGAGGAHPPKPSGGGCAVAPHEPSPGSGVYLSLGIVATILLRRRSWCGRARSSSALASGSCGGLASARTVPRPFSGSTPSGLCWPLASRVSSTNRATTRPGRSVPPCSASASASSGSSAWHGISRPG